MPRSLQLQAVNRTLNQSPINSTSLEGNVEFFNIWEPLMCSIKIHHALIAALICLTVGLFVPRDETSFIDFSSGRLKYQASIAGITYQTVVVETPLSKLTKEVEIRTHKPVWIVYSNTTYSLFEKRIECYRTSYLVSRLAFLDIILTSSVLSNEQRRDLSMALLTWLNKRNYDVDPIELFIDMCLQGRNETFDGNSHKQKELFDAYLRILMRDNISENL